MKQKLNQDTPTWRLFEELMMNREEGAEPWYSDPMPRGAAINTAMGLNKSNMYYWREVRMQQTDAKILWSAKAKDLGYDDLWVVEISRNEARQGKITAGTLMMQAMLEKAYAERQQVRPQAQPANAPLAANAQDTLQEPDEDDVSDEATVARFRFMNSVSLETTGYPLIIQANVAAAMTRLGQSQDNYINRLMSQPAEPGYTPTPEEQADWEAASNARKASYSAANGIKDDEVWNCPKCSLPQLGRKTSVVEVGSDNMYQRVCNDCRGPMKEVRTVLDG